MTRDLLMEEGSVDFIPTVGKYSDVFLEELPGLPSEKEIEFCMT